MFEGLSTAALAGVFLLAAAAVWYAGIRLVDATDVLDEKWKLGAALGGIILLAVATNLPEIAITLSASAAGNPGVAVGNILGGIAIQTVVLVALDAFGMRDKRPLTYRAASLVLVLEGVLVIAVLNIAIMATQLPDTLIFARVTPGPLLIAILWVIGVWMIARAQKSLPWHEPSEDAPKLQRGPMGHSKRQRVADFLRQSSARGAVLKFAWASAVTLVAGVVLERSGDVIADRLGMSGVVFGATFLAVATALPELSTGFRAARKADYQLAISDIFGGNAFLPVLFLVATVVSGSAVLPRAENTDIYLAALGVLLTCVYVAGLIFRPRRRILGLGPDSLVVLVLYALGMLGLFAIGVGPPG